METKIYEPLCKFVVTNEAAIENWNIFVWHNFDLEAISKGSKRSAMTMGSEFKDTQELKKLLGRHPWWRKFRTILENGVNFESEPINNDLRRKDLEAAYDRGNHKSASKNEKFISDTMKKEIMQG